MAYVVKLMGSRIVVRDENDDATNLIVTDVAEADRLARKLRTAAKELREVAEYQRKLRARGVIS